MESVTPENVTAENQDRRHRTTTEHYEGEQERGGSNSRAAFPETTNTAEDRTTRDQGTTRVPVRQGLGSCAIFAKERGEAHNLLPFKEPVNLRVQRAGNCLP